MAKAATVRMAPTAGAKIAELRGVAGWYLICFDRPLVLGINVRREVRHYVGSTVNLAARLRKHATAPDARILQIARQHGVTWKVVRLWYAPEGTNGAARWAVERKLKGISAGRLCPCCHPGTKRGCRLNLAARLGTTAPDAEAELIAGHPLYEDQEDEQPW